MKFVVFFSLLLAVVILAWRPLQDSKMQEIRQQCMDDLNITKKVLKQLQFDDPEDYLALNFTYCKVVNFGFFTPGKGLDCQRIAEYAHSDTISTARVFNEIKNCCLDKNRHRVSQQLWAARMFTCVVYKDIYQRALKSKSAYENMVRREKQIHEWVLKLRKEGDEMEARQLAARNQTQKKKTTVQPKVNTTTLMTTTTMATTSLATTTSLPTTLSLESSDSY